MNKTNSNKTENLPNGQNGYKEKAIIEGYFAKMQLLSQSEGVDWLIRENAEDEFIRETLSVLTNNLDQFESTIHSLLSDFQGVINKHIESIMTQSINNEHEEDLEGQIVKLRNKRMVLGMKSVLYRTGGIKNTFESMGQGSRLVNFEKNTSDIIERVQKITESIVESDIDIKQVSSQNVDSKLDLILERTSKIERQFSISKDIDLSIETIEKRVSELSSIVDELEDKAVLYKERGLQIDSDEVQELLKGCKEVEAAVVELKREYDQVQLISSLVTENMSDVMQVIVVNDKGFYKELTSELDPSKFLTSLEVEKIAEGLCDKYPESKLMAIEVDRKMYMDINGISGVVAEKRDVLLKAEGDVKFEHKIPKQKVSRKDVSASTRGRTVQDKVDKVASKEDRNIVEALLSWTKLGSLITKNVIGGSINLFKRDKKNKASIDSSSEMIQIVAVEQLDGTFKELVSKRNKNLFIQPNELEAYVKYITQGNGKYHLLEVSKKDLPDINLYLDKGVLTEDGKLKYNAKKESFFKKQPHIATYEISNIVAEKSIKGDVSSKIVTKNVDHCKKSEKAVVAKPKNKKKKR